MENGNSVPHNNIDYSLTGSDFIRALVELILDEAQLVGNGEFIKSTHGEQIVDFKYPHEIEVKSRCKV